MHTTGIRDLRATLADAVRRAEHGQTTVITSHGHPVAQLAPLANTGATLDQLVASGQVIAPRRRSELTLPEPTPIWSGVRFDRVLGELR
ncbi:MAG: prevent-host-death protein [Ilumatobacter coccineus]|uniref:Antitoxin n=1 Tax=Ilumatobacter coccineus TaxID=467094 RepID=A0A2G6KAC4_9ACTN|nr:MAG: prevent-host-death protein [Ilumatobacter coccineus]